MKIEIFLVFFFTYLADGSHINMLFMQWKFVSLATEEHNKTILEKACSYGIGYSEYYVIS